MFKTSFTLPLKVPWEKINLEEWLYGISSEQYRAFSKKHIAMGRSIENLTDTLINVEKVCSCLMIHHYTPQYLGKERVELYSDNTEGYFFGIIPVKFSVSWDMLVKPKTKAESEFTCNIEVELKTLKFMDYMGRWYVMPLLNRHNREETPNFVKSIEDKFRNNINF